VKASHPTGELLCRAIHLAAEAVRRAAFVSLCQRSTPNRRVWGAGLMSEENRGELAKEGVMGDVAFLGSVAFCNTCSILQHQKKTGEVGIVRAAIPHLAFSARKYQTSGPSGGASSVPVGDIRVSKFLHHKDVLERRTASSGCRPHNVGPSLFRPATPKGAA
jgi:hypothetical protein